MPALSPAGTSRSLTYDHGVADDDSQTPVPDENELERTAVPARVRRAPKFGAFIVAGAVVGVVVAVLATLVVGWVRPDGASSDVAAGQGFISVLEGQGAIRALMGATGAVVGGFVGGALAVHADRRSRDPLR